MVTLRVPGSADLAVLVAGRDKEFHRWLGAEAETAPPLACIVVADRVVGWIDYDIDRSWLQDGEVNVGYFLLAGERGKGFVTCAVELLLRHLADETSYKVATLLIDLRNLNSLAVAAALPVCSLRVL